MKSKKLNVIDKVKSSESTISMFLGIAVVIVVGVLIFNYFKSAGSKLKEPSGTENKESQNIENKEENSKPLVSLPAKYTVKKGDHLWKISLEFYGSGYNWVDIAKENNLKSPGMIKEGQELSIPDVPVKKILEKKAETIELGKVGAITGDTYTVVKGDSLWTISVRAYQDGYKWPEIAKVNNLSNPSLIFKGNTLVIPR